MRDLVTQWDVDGFICDRCSGTGCVLCGGGGEVQAHYLVHVTCACGWECDGHDFDAAMAKTDGRCPDCSTSMQREVERERPEFDPGEPDYDLLEEARNPW